MDEKTAYIKRLEEKIGKRNKKTAQKPEFHNKPTTSKKSTVIPDNKSKSRDGTLYDKQNTSDDTILSGIKKTITGINGTANKKRYPYPYDINNTNILYVGIENLKSENKKNNKFLKPAVLAVLTIVTGITALTDNSVSRMFKQGQVIEYFTGLSEDKEALKITAINYQAIENKGFGDGIMLSRNGYYLLTDTFSEECRPSLEKYLKDNNISKFDIYISHIDHDHIDNLFYCVENYDVSKVYLPNLSKFDDIEKKLKAKGVEVPRRLEKGETFEIGDKDCIGEVIYGPKKGVSDNNSSLVTKITVKTKTGDIIYLTGGDIEKETANEILALGIDISAHIMKLDHHGGGDTPEYVRKVGASYYINNYNKEKDGWIGEQYEAADENGNVLSTLKNGEITLSIKNSGEIVPIIEKNYEKVDFEVKDDNGEIIETVTYDLNIDSSHVLTDQMKEAIIYKHNHKGLEPQKPLTDGTPIQVSSKKVLENLNKPENKNNYGLQGFTMIDDNHFAVAVIRRNKGYICVYDMSGKLLSTTEATKHNNCIQADKDNAVILSIGGTETGGSHHQQYGLDFNSYKLDKQQTVNNRSTGNALGMDSFNSKDYVITLGRRTWIYLFKR